MVDYFVDLRHQNIPVNLKCINMSQNKLGIPYLSKSLVLQVPILKVNYNPKAIQNPVLASPKSFNPFQARLHRILTKLLTSMTTGNIL